MSDMPTVAMIVDNHFEQSEVEEVRELLKEADFKIDLIATKERSLQALDGDTEKGDNFLADRLIGEVDADDYDAVVLPGGVVNADRLRMNTTIHKLLVEFDEADKLIAAICHAPWVLISSGLVDGRVVTGYPSLKDDLKNAGATWMDKSVVIDGNLITSRHPGDIPEFSEAVIDLLREDSVEEWE